MVAIAGPNGAGKSTFFHAHLAETGLYFVNADVLALKLNVDPYLGAQLANELRRALIARRESFVFETVLSDPVGDKIAFLEDCANAGYTVVLCFIGLASIGQSEERVAMRVSQGGHDVPADKLQARFPRSIANLKRAIERLPHVLIFDNSALDQPFRQIAVFHATRLVFHRENTPDWLRNVLDDSAAF